MIGGNGLHLLALNCFRGTDLVVPLPVEEQSSRGGLVGVSGNAGNDFDDPGSVIDHRLEPARAKLHHIAAPHLLGWRVVEPVPGPGQAVDLGAGHPYTYR